MSFIKCYLSFGIAIPSKIQMSDNIVKSPKANTHYILNADQKVHLLDKILL